MKKILCLIMFAMALLAGCAKQAAPLVKEEIPPPPAPEEEFLFPEQYNVRFIAYDDGIADPDNDRRSYYRVFIDKTHEARTTTGLESQEKTFEAYLEPNRHLIVVEKWVLDEAEGKYVKLNNIDQPRPNFVYFDVPANRVVVIRMITRPDMTADFTIDLARK